MRIQPEHNTTNIILVGDLNPKIFHPEWFARHEIIDQGTYEAAEVEIVHSEIAKFHADWLRIQVEKNRFIAETNEAPFVRVFDLAVKTFGELLIHTPIRKMGINRTVDFPVASQEVKDRIGNRLAPKDAWGEWGSEIEGRTPEKHGGLISVTMEQRDLDDRNEGYIRAKVEPSNKIKYGVYVDLNDHYVVTDSGQSNGCEQIIELLTKSFDRSVERSEWIIDQIMRLSEE